MLLRSCSLPQGAAMKDKPKPLGKPKAAPPAKAAKGGAGDAKAAVGDIFAALGTAPKAAKPAVTNSAGAAAVVAGKAHAKGEVGPPSRVVAASSAAAGGEGRRDERAPQPGLYVAPDAVETAMAMDDDSFFNRPVGGGVGGAGGGGGSKRSAEKEGVNRIVSEEEFNKMLRGNRKKGVKPGYSPLCPFDCDCCF